MTATAAEIIGAKVCAANCPSCTRSLPVEVSGPWHGTLVDQFAAAAAQAEAECPDHGDGLVITDRRSQRSSPGSYAEIRQEWTPEQVTDFKRRWNAAAGGGQ